VALKSFHLITDGIFLWEFFTTLDYEFDIIRGHRPYRWSIWIYSITRAATLMAIILNLIDLNTMTPINCQIWLTFELIFAYLGLAAASLLIVLRVIAIWNKGRIIVATATTLWVTNIVIMIQGIVRLRSNWSATLLGCDIFNSGNSKLNIISCVVTDLVLLLAVLVGLFRLRSYCSGTFHMGRFLWKQGVLWLLLATLAEVPPAVFIILDLNGSFNLMFQLPSLIAMTIGATRMYRSLVDFASSTTDIASDILQNGNNNVSKLEWGPSPRDRIEVTVDTSYERHRVSRASYHGTHTGTVGQRYERPQGMSLDKDPENPIDTRVTG